MKPESEILSEYASAVYEIYEPEIILHVGEISQKLDMLLTQHGDEMWAFITPYNPYPEQLSPEENTKRLEELSQMIEGYTTYSGEGRDEDTDDSPKREIGYYILWITLDEARRIGNHFGQKAILFGHIGKPPELVVLK